MFLQLSWSREIWHVKARNPHFTSFLFLLSFFYNFCRTSVLCCNSTDASAQSSVISKLWEIFIIFYQTFITFYETFITFYQTFIIFYQTYLIFYQRFIIFYQIFVTFYHKPIIFYQISIIFYHTPRFSASEN